MDKTYQPQDIEHKWYQHWESENHFAPSGEGQPYCIMLPPPNVTGSLHMGHGFQHTLMDALIRYQRMNGRNTLWQPGTDHAGISTQIVVERQLEAQGVKREDMAREAFVDKVWQWKQESGSNITRQLRRMGSSVDWTKERFTLDEGLSQAVLKVFVQLHDEGLIYRGTRLVNWDPKLGTAVSDLEVISSEEQGQLWHLRYPIHGTGDHLTVATTRPETMLGDSAVAVHPEDERYRDLIGKSVALPLCDRLIPIIADDYVDPQFGSGCVKITPAHDFNDYQMGERHHLEQISILDKSGNINDNAPKAYQGLDRFEARTRVVADLDALGLVEKIEPHTLKVPRGEKSGVIIEPLITKQWFVKIAPLAEPAIKAVEDGEIKFVPENWSNTYFQWMNNIEDWCISRQLWWGHRIPAWYDDNDNVYVGYSENDVRFKYQLDESLELRQDDDVLDTWFSSALWPFSTLGWPEKNDVLETFYPTSVLVTGFDIIFFWVARMIMMGLKFTGKVPFKEIYITGLIRDAEGKKMSKSKGNVLDPIDLIDGISLDNLLEKRTSNLMLGSALDKIAAATKKEFPEGLAAYGTDALRFTFCALASTGRDIRFDLGRVDGYRNFCNKLWNASRYVIMNTKNNEKDWEDGAFQYSPADQWILSRLQRCIATVHQHFADYRFDLIAQSIHEFVWHEYCDWYLELSKPVLYDDNTLVALKRGTRKTLVQVLEVILRLAHPLMPFISEEIWQRVSAIAGTEGDTIMNQAYPQADESLIDDGIESEIEWLKQVIQGVRNIRGEMNISPKQTLPVFFNKGKARDAEYLEKYRDDLKALAKLSEINWLDEDESAPPSATALVDHLEVLIPMAGLIDKDAESKRLNKEIEKITKDLTRVEGKLTNPQFVDKAPEAVIAKEKQRQSTMNQALASLQEQLNQLDKL